MTGIVVAGLAALVLSGCAPTPQTYASGSRSHIYSSIEELKQDASASITGKVTSQEVTRDQYGKTITLSSFEIASIEDLPLDDGAGSKNLVTGGTVTIRQLGSPTDTQPVSPILKVEESYLLFVNPSGLEGSDATQYFITGNTAGYYEKSDSGRGDDQYVKVGDEGDSLPETLSPK